MALFDAEPLLGQHYSLLSNECLPEDEEDVRTQKRTCKDIIDLTQNPMFKANQSICRMIQRGYQDQKVAQMQLLSEIQNIHNAEYKIISKIELD